MPATDRPIEFRTSGRPTPCIETFALVCLEGLSVEEAKAFLADFAAAAAKHRKQSIRIIDVRVADTAVGTPVIYQP